MALNQNALFPVILLGEHATLMTHAFDFESKFKINKEIYKYFLRWLETPAWEITLATLTGSKFFPSAEGINTKGS